MVPSQANPVWLDGSVFSPFYIYIFFCFLFIFLLLSVKVVFIGVLSQDSYEVWFTVTVPALGLATYHVERAQDSVCAVKFVLIYH